MNNLDKARQKQNELREAGLLTHKDPLEKSLADPTSFRKAVNAKCWQCQGADADPCVRWRIGNCEIPECGLFILRPYQNLTNTPTPSSLVVE